MVSASPDTIAHEWVEGKTLTEDDLATDVTIGLRIAKKLSRLHTSGSWVGLGGIGLGLDR